MAKIRNLPGPQRGFQLLFHEFSRDPRVTPRAARLYIYLRSHDDNWETNYERISRAIGMNPGTVSKAVADLVALGYMQEVRQSRGEGGRYAESEYVTHALPHVKKQHTGGGEADPDESPGSDRSLKNRARLNRGRQSNAYKETNSKETNRKERKDSPLADAPGDGPATVAETPVWDTPPLIERPSLDPESSRSATRPSPRSETPVEAPAPVDAPDAPETTPRPGEGRVPDDVTPEFLDWYDRYPVSKGRKDGFKAWWKAVRRISVEDLNAATDRYAEWVEAGGVSDKKYVPYPATWLNGERWDDDLPDPRAASRPSNSVADWLSPEDLAELNGETYDLTRTDYSNDPYIDGDS